ncbi:hypothetical protein CONCODRAFT_80788 [Conidiobolus coronatus NRRL 28638]|uniref:BED-type domain-containing protein n=1 Tax=Conidiobolus coronatus (strain ATCC 28846 / CBS 209.66 / NRRL 28638) TaxID=796925 RepID=A0A137NRG3_CONC2|nr:hypothetical protein CONCODRAFT_80788 [Conidiobolus coronatus NRRL 28638]|eukprot:KXN65353.1 hypothetical protein CONCODRAFT_80788 [Conidiobolus coronatus NRRL 28638]
MAQANNTVPDSIPNESHIPISTNAHSDSFAQDSDSQEPLSQNNSSKLTLRLHNVTRPMDQSSKFRSEAWNYFQVVDGRAICKLCNKPYVYSQGSTSNLLRHVKSHQGGSNIPQNSNVIKDIRPKIKTPPDNTAEAVQHIQQEEHTSEPRSIPQPQHIPPPQPPKDTVPTYTPPVTKQMSIPQNNGSSVTSYRPSYTPPGTTDAVASSTTEPSAKRSKVETHYHELTPPAHPTHQIAPPPTPQPPKVPAAQRPPKQPAQSIKAPEAPRTEEYDEEAFRNDLVNLFLNNNLSFDLIESPDFITLFRKLTPHKLCSSTMMKLLVLTKLQLQGKELFENLGKKH